MSWMKREDEDRKWRVATSDWNAGLQYIRIGQPKDIIYSLFGTHASYVATQPGIAVLYSL